MTRPEESQWNKLRWIEHLPGGDEVVVFLHGFPDDPHVWEKLWCNLDPRFGFLAPYLRTEGPFGTNAVVLDLLALLRYRGLLGHKIHLVAHDIAGPAVCELAHLLGASCQSLVLIATLPSAILRKRIQQSRHWHRSWYISLFQATKLMQQFFTTSVGQKLLDRNLKAGGMIPTETTHAQAVRLLPHYRALLADTLAATSAPLHQPTLLLWGKDDPFLAVPTQDECLGIGLKPTLRVLAGKHWPQLTMADEVSRVLRLFWQDHA